MMDFQEWVGLLGRAAQEPEVRDALARAGITGRVKIGRQELSTREDIAGEGMTIVFTDETILRPDNPGSILNRPIISAVMVVLGQPNEKNVYKGPLPYRFTKGDSQAAVRARLGPPARINEKYQADAWEIDGMTLAACYSEDLLSLEQVSLSLPNSH
ncbi:MAG TPA: hypothetical protein VF800_28645 [Telluria sp.]|jgi:hypothetical protein